MRSSLLVFWANRWVHQQPTLLTPSLSSDAESQNVSAKLAWRRSTRVWPQFYGSTLVLYNHGYGKASVIGNTHHTAGPHRCFCAPQLNMQQVNISQFIDPISSPMMENHATQSLKHWNHSHIIKIFDTFLWMIILYYIWCMILTVKGPPVTWQFWSYMILASRRWHFIKASNCFRQTA